MEITVLGWYGQGNIGDESYKIAFPKIFPDHKFKFCNQITETPEVLILGGGNVVADFFLNQIKDINVPKHAMSINIFKKSMLDKLRKLDFRYILSRNKVPDEFGIQTVPDFSFILEATRENGKQLIENIFKANKSELYEKVVVVVVNAYVNVGESILARNHVTFDKFAFDLARISDNTMASFLFLSFGNGFPHNDRISNSIVYSRCKFWKKNVICYEKIDVQDTLDILSAADAVLSMRLHSSIFSCIGGTPFIDITHHDKNRVLLDFIGKKEWGLNYWRFDATACEMMLKELLDDNSEERYFLNKISFDYRESLQKLSSSKFLDS